MLANGKIEATSFTELFYLLTHCCRNRFRQMLKKFSDSNGSGEIFFYKIKITASLFVSIILNLKKGKREALKQCANWRKPALSKKKQKNTLEKRRGRLQFCKVVEKNIIFTLRVK